MNTHFCLAADLNVHVDNQFKDTVTLTVCKEDASTDLQMTKAQARAIASALMACAAEL